MKHVSNGKECKARLVSSRNNSSRSGGPPNNNNNSSSSNEAARPHQSITARDAASRKVDIKDNPGKRHLQGNNNFWRINTSGSGTKIPEPFQFVVAFDSLARCSGVCVKRQALGTSASTTIRRFGRRLTLRL